MKQKLPLLFLLFPLWISAQSPDNKAGYGSEIRLQSDNDNYALTYKDGYYTNGLFIQLIQTPRKANAYLYRHPRVVKLMTTLTVGQMIYNAETWRKQNYDDLDRPYAAYLFLRKGYIIHYRNHSVLEINLSAGTTGKDAFGEQVQNTYHSLLGFPHIRAWQYQLNGEPSLNLQLNYHQNLLSAKNKGTRQQLHATVHLQAGNVFTNVTAGLLFKTGMLRGTSGSSYYLSETGYVPEPPARRWCDELVLFAHPQLMLQGYNATLQGPLFKTIKGPLTAEPVRLYYFHQFGLIYSKARFSAVVSYYFKEKETATMRRNERYGSFAVSYRLIKKTPAHHG